MEDDHTDQQRITGALYRTGDSGLVSRPVWHVATSNTCASQSASELSIRCRISKQIRCKASKSVLFSVSCLISRFYALIPPVLRINWRYPFRPHYEQHPQKNTAGVRACCQVSINNNQLTCTPADYKHDESTHLRPHFLNIFQNHIAVSVERFYSAKQFSVVPAVDQDLHATSSGRLAKDL